MEALRKRAHNNVIPLVASFDSSTAESGVDIAYLYMVFPVAAGGDMEDWIHSPSTPPSLRTGQDHVRDYIYGVIFSVASGLAFIHLEIGGYITAHHDLKPRNFVLESNTWKICGFGKSHLKSAADESGTAHEIGTPEYRPSSWRKFQFWISTYDFLNIHSVSLDSVDNIQVFEIRLLLSTNPESLLDPKMKLV